MNDQPGRGHRGAPGDDVWGHRARRRGRFGPFGRDMFGPGFGNPRARWGPGGRGRGGGRRHRGDVRAAILALVAEEPMHGYQIIQEIAERSDGAWTPSPGSIYPTVSQLADEGLVRTETSDGRSVVHLTEHGRRYAEEHRDELDAVWNTAGAPDIDELAELRTAGRELIGAAAQVAHVGSPAQLTEAIRLLNDTRRRLYLLLAGDTGDDPGAGRGPTTES